MDCREAMELLSLYLDGELSPAEAGALEAHLEMCVACREEMETLRLISEALRAEADAVKAPPGLAGGVMAALKQQRGPWYGRLPGIWKQAVAVAAALALVAAGSLHMGLGQFFTRVGPQVAENPPGSGVTEPGPRVSHTDPGVPAPEAPGDPVDPSVPDNTGANDQEPDTEAVAGDTPDKPETPAAKPAPAKPNIRPTATEAPATYEARVFLSKQRAVRSTLLKVRVDNVAAALDQALRLGGTYGAEFQMTQRISNGQVEVVRLTVGREQADVLTGKLAALGRVITRDSTVQDITGQFDRTREQYQGLLAKLNTVPDGAERTEMEATLRSLENQLADWDREAERYVIVLWLQP